MSPARKTMWHTSLWLAAAWVVFSGLTACGIDGTEHLANAKNEERKLLAAGKDITYADKGYLAVAKELERVPPWSDEYDEARDILQKIKDARRVKLSEVRYLDYLPERLEGVDVGSLRPEPGESHSSTGSDRPAKEPAGAPDRVDSSADAANAEAGSGRSGTAPVADGVGLSNGAPRKLEAKTAMIPVRSSRESRSVVSEPEAVTTNHEASKKTIVRLSDPEASTISSTTASEKPVILYMTSWCGYCRKAAAYLKSRKVPFVAKNVETDPAAAREVAAKTGGYGGIPVLDIDGTIIRGYSRPAIDAALARRSRRQ